MLATANPTRLTKLLDPEAVHQHRSLFCPEYDRCLRIAASGGWTSWSCERCAFAGWTTSGGVLLDVPSRGCEGSLPDGLAAAAMP